MKIHNVFILGLAVAVSLTLKAASPVDLSPIKELLSIPSVSADVAANDKAIDWMRGYLESRGVWCVVETFPKDGRKILYAATKPGLKAPDYVLVTHLDVVGAGDPAPKNKN
jgi:acetylornithine deacetylase/succinyl-diaminopimelate desuccinylase-like protein